MPRLLVRHITTYRYRQPVAFGEHRIMARPRDGYDQRVISTEIDIVPAPASLSWTHDVFDNCVALARFDRRAEELRFDCHIALDHQPVSPLSFALSDHAATYPFSYGPDEMPDLLRLIERNWRDADRAVDRWVRQFLRSGRRTSTQELLADITLAIRRDFTYAVRDAAGVQDPATTLATRTGSCRDFAVLMMEAVRALGFAARFVSGYLHNPGTEADGSGGSRIGADATHAWVQVFLPGAGWVEFDPTNGIVGTNRDLIRVAVARDPSQAVPLSGTWTGFPSDSLGMTVEVEVTAVDGPPSLEDAPAQPLRSIPATSRSSLG